MSVILRTPPYPLSVSYTVPDESADYILVIEDVPEQTELEVFISGESGLNSSSQGKITYELSGDFVRYDKSYAVTVYEDIDGERGDIVVEDNLQVERPYVDPVAIAASYNETSATEIAKYKEYESLARERNELFSLRMSDLLESMVIVALTLASSRREVESLCEKIAGFSIRTPK